MVCKFLSFSGAPGSRLFRGCWHVFYVLEHTAVTKSQKRTSGLRIAHLHERPKPIRTRNGRIERNHGDCNDKTDPGERGSAFSNRVVTVRCARGFDLEATCQQISRVPGTAAAARSRCNNERALIARRERALAGCTHQANCRVIFHASVATTNSGASGCPSGAGSAPR